MSSALTGKLDTDVEIKASVQEFHDVFWKKPHHVPNTCNDRERRGTNGAGNLGQVMWVHLHEGEFGNVGSIVVWNVTHDGVTKMAKTVVEAVDPDKNSITYRVIEGDVTNKINLFKRRVGPYFDVLDSSPARII